MGLEFLARVRRSSIVAGLVVTLAVAAAAPYALAGGFAAGVAWSLVNLALLQFVVVTMTGPERGTGAAFRRLALAFAGSLALFAAGAFLLTKLPIMALAAGFTFPFLVMVLKAASAALLESAFWRRRTASPWQAGVLVLTLVGATWWASTNFQGATRADAQTETHATEHAAPATDAHATEAAPAAGAEGAEGAGGAATGHGEAAAGEHAAGGHEKAEGPQVFENVLGLIVKSAEHAAEEKGQPVPAWVHFLHQFEIVIYSLFVAVLISIIAISVANNWQSVPGPLQALVETWVEHAWNFFCGILGPKYGPRFVPFLGTLFVYIYVMNVIGLIPFMHSPTSNLNITVAMALTVFVYVQFTAFRELGFLGWLDHMAGSPRDVVGWALVPLMMPVHLIGEIAKPISLSCRLFGNIFGEDMLLVGFATLGVSALSALHLPFGLPLQVPFMFLAALITSPVQALVFTMLSTIYFLLMLPHDHDHGHEHHGEEAHHAH
ncbi:MAG: F0F1 ATP synthase subunit A [Candidatus Eisenbacteria bacterium]|uniref:ATP synthase subunit a n=1 Tax=Eiseniibacteriota bacterium TaxID=2212470 RepID=A0A933WAL1_UNCEI|nr:F0F1 ATP synthase subunit A [Candidatus Eisenbacteria bacterium]